jgi:hypothetical protein
MDRWRTRPWLMEGVLVELKSRLWSTSDQRMTRIGSLGKVHNGETFISRVEHHKHLLASRRPHLIGCEDITKSRQAWEEIRGCDYLGLVNSRPGPNASSWKVQMSWGFILNLTVFLP